MFIVLKTKKKCSTATEQTTAELLCQGPGAARGSNKVTQGRPEGGEGTGERLSRGLWEGALLLGDLEEKRWGNQQA